MAPTESLDYHQQKSRPGFTEIDLNTLSDSIFFELKVKYYFRIFDISLHYGLYTSARNANQKARALENTLALTEL